MSAAQCLSSGSKGGPHWDYIYQMVQQRFMLGNSTTDYVDFVK